MPTPDAAAAPAGAASASLAYWREALNLLEPIDLPLDFPRPPVASRRGASHRSRLDAATTAHLRRLCDQQSLPLHLGLLAGLAATLCRITNQDQVAIGVPVAATAAAPENVLVLRLRRDDSQTFGDLLAATGEIARAAFAHRDLPFADLAAQLEKVPDPSRHPLYQVGFSMWDDGGAAAATWPGLGNFTPPAGGQEVAHRELEIFAAEKAGELELTVVYAAELFTATSLQRWFEALAALLAAGAQEPQRSVHRLPLLPASERQKIVAGHGARPLDFPQDRLLHETFFRQAAQTPHNIALRSGPDQRTFGEAAALASKVAWALRRQGVGPEVRVGVFLERTHRLVASLIGVLAADGAYVPLDPEYPAERIGFTLDDRRLLELRARYARAEWLANAMGDVILWAGRSSRRYKSGRRGFAGSRAGAAALPADRPFRALR